jgi:hypothetical protein
VADVLERVLAGEDIGKILGTHANRGRPHKFRKAILVHAMVRRLMQQRRRRWRRGDDAKVEVAEFLGMNLDTVLENYKRVQKLIKKVKDYPKDDPFLDLDRSGFSALEQGYLMDQERAVFLLDFGLALPSAFYVDGRTEPLADLFRRRMAALAPPKAPDAEGK